MTLAGALRLIGLAGLVAVAVYAWNAREPDLSDRAIKAAEAAGASSIVFSEGRDGRREAFSCGAVDGQRALFRETAGLTLDDGSPQWGALYRSWCSHDGAAP